VARIELQYWWRLPQQLRFLLVGGYNTAFGYLVFSGLYLIFGRWIHYLVIGLLAYIVSLISAFVGYRFLVFQSTAPWRKNFVRFNSAQLIAMGCGMAGLYVLVEFIHLSPISSQGLVILASSVLTYLLHRFFSFRDRKDA
jgi:putative flippase GtrA